VKAEERNSGSGLARTRVEMAEKLMVGNWKPEVRLTARRKVDSLVGRNQPWSNLWAIVL